MSRNVLPAARQVSASSATQSGDNVADVTSVDAAADPAMIPSSPSHTDRDESSSAVASNTTSASVAAAAGVGAAVAPAATSSVVRLGSAVPDDHLMAVAQEVDRHPCADHTGADDGDSRHQNDGPTVTVTGGADTEHVGDHPFGVLQGDLLPAGQLLLDAVHLAERGEHAAEAAHPCRRVLEAELVGTREVADGNVELLGADATAHESLDLAVDQPFDLAGVLWHRIRRRRTRPRRRRTTMSPSTRCRRGHAARGSRRTAGSTARRRIRG